MWLNLAITVALAIAITAMVILTPHMVARIFGTRCPDGRRRPINQFDYHMFYDPPPAWELYRCAHCGSDFIRTSNGFTPRAEWTGDREAERTFKEIEMDADA